MRGRIIVAALGLGLLGALPIAAQNTYQDSQARFAIDLPAGFSLASEQLGLVYLFKKGSAMIMLSIKEDAADRNDVWDYALGCLGKGTPPPPEGTIFDMDVNGNPARWAKYSYEQDVERGKKVPLTANLGAVLLEGTETGIMYMMLLNEKMLKPYSEAAVQAFNSIRLPGAPLTGATAPVAAKVKPPAVQAEQEAAAAPEAEVPSSTFEHPLITMSIPAGWTAKQGEGMAIATIEHPKYGKLQVIGAEKNKFGKSREDIHKMFSRQFQESMPSIHQTREPYDLPTAAGTPALINESEAEIIAAGKNLQQWVLLGAFKDSRRGFAFLWLTSPAHRDEALEQVLGIIKSLR